jgi:hypothetical protein
MILGERCRLTRSCRVCRNPIDGLRGTNIGGTIGGRVAYSLLHGFESTPSKGVLRLLKAKVAMKPLLSISPNSLKTKGVDHIGTLGLTYRGFVRQIGGVSRVAMSQTSSQVGKRMLSMPSSRYRYSTAFLTGAFLNMFETCARQINCTNFRVSA